MIAGPGECPACREAVEEGAIFCRHCGEALSSPRSGGREAARRGNERTDPSLGLVGEHKQVTVLFADVQGSMSISEQVEPEEWHRIIGGFFSILGDATRHYGGTISRYTGDGLMCLFGAPTALEDHAERACLAALRARDALARYALEMRRTRGVAFSVRIGLDSGSVVATSIGEEIGSGYSALGRTVSLAEKLEQLATPGSIFVSEGTRARVAEFFELRDLGWFEIKAFPAPVRIFELRGRGERRSRIDSARARGFARFVGRKRELERLEGALEKVVLGEGQIVQVVGEAGIGKSRLCHEFLESCRERGLRTGDWQVLSHLPTTPLLGFVEFLRSRLGIPPTDPPAVVREKLSRLGGGEVPWIEDFSRLIADMLSVPEDAHETGVGGPSRPIVDVGRLVEDLALAAGRLGPWVIVLEDVHWLTSEAAAILHGILAIVPRTRAMLLLTVRTEGSTPAWLGSVGETLHLGPLDVVDANGIVRDLLGEDPSIAPLSGRILERSAGNAFYIGELVQSLVECGAIVGEKGAYRLGRLEGAIALPATVEALLGARIDRLQGREKSVLRAAAVIGPEFARRILERSLGADEEEIGRALEALTAAEFVERRDDPGEERYRFRHPLLHEAAYGSQLEASRAPLHAAVAAALAEGEPGELDERAAVIADHLMRGGERLAAARWGSRAARWITTRNVTEALKAWERVASLLDHVEPTEESRRLWLEATINLLELGSRVGIGRERAARLFEAGDEIAAGLGDDRGRARLHGAYAQLRAMKGDPHGTIDLTRRAIVMARRSGDEHLVADLRIALVFGYLTAGRFREVRALAEEVLQPWPLPRGGSRGRIERAMDGYLLLFHGMAILDMGCIAEARREIELVIEAARRLGATELLCLAYGFAPAVAQVAGDDPRDALGQARRAVELAERLASPFAEGLARWGLGIAQLLSGDWIAATETLNAVLAVARERGVGLQGEGGLLAHLAEAAIGRGDLSAAEDLAERAVMASVRRRTGFFESVALLSLARIRLLARGAAARREADALLVRAQALIRADDLHSLQPLVHAVRALQAFAGQEEAEARRELERARDLFSEFGARGQAERIAEFLPSQVVAS